MARDPDAQEELPHSRSEVLPSHREEAEEELRVSEDWEQWDWQKRDGLGRCTGRGRLGRTSKSKTEQTVSGGIKGLGNPPLQNQINVNGGD